MELSAKVLISQQAMARQVGEETVILDLASGSYFGLDAVGARVWQLLNEGKSIREVCDAIDAEYEVSREQVERDVVKLIEDLVSRGLVVTG